MCIAVEAAYFLKNPVLFTVNFKPFKNYTNTLVNLYLLFRALCLGKSSDISFNCDTQTPPPSALDEVCVQFNRKVSEK